MKIELKEQNLIDKHSRRLLSAFRVICNCYDAHEQEPDTVFTAASAFLYCLMFVLYAEELKLTNNKQLTDFLLSVHSQKSSSDQQLSDNFQDIIKQQCYKVCKAPIFSNIHLNLNSFKFTSLDLINLSDYVLLDNNGTKIDFVTLKLEFLNYFYELVLKFSIAKTDQNLVVIHKGGHETYKEEEIKDHTQLSLNLDFEPVETILAGQWYITKACKKKQCQGAFYTPPRIVDYITDKTLQQLPSLKNIKIIDPACGCGSFLLNIFYYLKDHGIKDKDIIENYLYGIDIDPISVEISRLILTLASGTYSSNIHCSDTLDKKSLPVEMNSFDAVIGNPPYLNIERIDKDKKSYYLKNYKSAVRRFDLYILFIEQAIEMLLKDNGALGYIIPDKLLTQSYAKGIREIILDQCSISQIVELKYNGLFKGANVIPIILICKKPWIDKHFVKITQLKPDTNSSSEIKQEDFRNTYNFIFRLSLDDTKKSILDHIQTKSKPVSKACYISWGLQPGNTKKFIFNENDKEKFEMFKNHPTLRNLIRGSCVNYYNITYMNDKVLYITEGKDKLHRPAFPELFETDKIVIPAVSGSRGLIAAIDSDHYYTNHSIICVIMKRDLLDVDKKLLKARGIKLELTKSNQEEDLWQVNTGAYTRTTTVYRTDRDSLLNIRYILALMNSKLIRFYFNNFLTGELNVFPELVKRLPFLDIEFEEETYEPKNLKSIPILNKFKGLSQQDLHDQIVRLTYEIDSSQPHQRPAFIELIDKAVYELYGLNDKYIEFIDTSLN
jgi:type I restriction-modification system DNA methylase subunit